MKYGSCPALVLRFIVILLAVECSNANVHQGRVGPKGKHSSSSETEKDESLHTKQDVFEGTIVTAYSNYGRKILEGRKRLSGMDEKPIYISPGKTKPGDPEKSFPESQNKEIDHIDAKVKKDRLVAYLEAAADEVANLMRKDYTGSGHGRRKPPINNQEPKD